MTGDRAWHVRATVLRKDDASTRTDDRDMLPELPVCVGTCYTNLLCLGHRNLQRRNNIYYCKLWNISNVNDILYILPIGDIN